MQRSVLRIGSWVFAALLSPLTLSACGHLPTATDPHYTPAGFFDVHVCNWPEQPQFLMALWSTTRFTEVTEVAVFSPDGVRLGALDLSKYRTVPQKSGAPEKRAFITHFELPPHAKDGWYAAEVTLAGAERHQARDYVLHQLLPQAQGLRPTGTVADVPTTLRWQAVPGAAYYQVFVKDMWNDGAVIYTSTLLREPEVALPPGLLRRDGGYAWRVHARDIHEHPRLGDFNHGSLSAEAVFFIQP